MGKTGKITSIKKEYNKNNGSLEASLAMHGYSRFPGTFVRMTPAKEKNNLDFKTGLNIKAPYMEEMRKKNPENYKLEVERITKLKEDLERRAGGISLDPQAPFYKDIHNDRASLRATTARLKEGDNIFDLDDVFAAITYEWLKVHPLIASSYQAYERGEYPSNTQFYVNDENIEEEIKYKKKTLINKAIVTLDALGLEKRKKVARLLGLPVSDNSKEQIVYNVLDTFIKQAEIKTGEWRGGNPVDLFNKFANMNDDLVATKDLVDQAIKHSVYRITKGGRITEGGQEIAKTREELVDFLMNEKNQDDLLALQEKLKVKKTLLTN